MLILYLLFMYYKSDYNIFNVMIPVEVTGQQNMIVVLKLCKKSI